MVIYRKLMPSEWSEYRAHLLRLNEKDRRARFLVPVSDATIIHHVEHLDPGWSVVIGAFIDGMLRGAVELCGGPREGRELVELAVSVELEAQGQGVGTELVRRAVLFAQNRSIKRIILLCLLENRRMQYITRKCTGTLDLDAADVIGEIGVPPPNAVSMWQEAFNEHSAAVIALVGRWPSREHWSLALA